MIERYRPQGRAAEGQPAVQACGVGEVAEPRGGGQGEQQGQAERQPARGGGAVRWRPGQQRRGDGQPGGDKQDDGGQVAG
jgi:hypothetical protein